MHAVVVGVEYRLGVAGWLALDSLRARDARGGGLVGNYGLLDVLAALKWVQRNALHFGGDPARVTVCGQSSGGSLVFALLASPASRGLLHAAISLSGSPRLNSTTAEASSYWHRAALSRTRCARSSSTAHEAACLLSLDASELLHAAPPEWHADVFGLGVFQPSFRYAPLLLLDGARGVLPSPYVDAVGAAPAHMDVGVPLVVGATAQEADFAPADDVRNMSATSFAGFLHERLDSSLGPSLVDRIQSIYVPPHSHASFEAQRVYSEIVSDATVVCPNFYLASSWQRARPRHGAPVRAYRASQCLSRPFCVLRDKHFSPPYCPLYSFHASDMFAWLQPERSSRFDYSFNTSDRSYGQLLRDAFGALVRAPNGSSHMSWGACTHSGAPPMREALPGDFVAAELRLPAVPVKITDKHSACALWLGSGFYERVGLINAFPRVRSSQDPRSVTDRYGGAY